MTDIDDARAETEPEAQRLRTSTEARAVEVRARPILVCMAIVDGALLLLHLLSRGFGPQGPIQRHEFIDLDAEISLPTWWQQSLALAAGGLALLVAGVLRRSDGSSTVVRQWVALGAIFVYLSVDEGTQFHEGLIDPMQSAFDISSGPLYFAWVIPAVGALIVFAAVFVRFWWRLPSLPRLLLATGGILFVVGALGFEMVGGAYRSDVGVDQTYAWLIAVEEGFEMMGMTVVVLALLRMLQAVQPESGAAVKVVDR